MKGRQLVWAIIVFWVAIAGLLSFVTPSAKDVTSTPPFSGLPESAPSVNAEQAVNAAFPNENGIPLLVVVQANEELTGNLVTSYAEIIEAAAEPLENDIHRILPLSKVPEEHRGAFQSTEEPVFFIPMILDEDLESSSIHGIVEQLNEMIQPQLPAGVDVYFTGPAGILSDTIALFSQADIVLLLATIALIFVLLIVIYRSPILAVLPLIAAGIVHQIVDGLIGLGGENGWFVVESQALSIMMILVFAVLTDYALLIVSRYKEHLQEGHAHVPAMYRAIRGVAEPIVFSGGTIFVGVLTLFAAAYAPYHNFAAVFAIAVAVMTPAGLTLLPALIVVTGRAAFWPLKLKFSTKPLPIWSKIAKVVGKYPRRMILVIAAVFSIGILSVTQISYSFNLLDTFPDDLSSKKGFEVLADGFSPGELAPNTVLIHAEERLDEDDLASFIDALNEREHVSDAFLLELNEDETVANVRLLLSESPYTTTSLNEMDQLRQEIADLWPGDADISIAGETAKQADIRTQNETDTRIVIVLMIVGITVMLGFLTRSVVAPFYMMGTLLLSYAATLGLVRWLFADVLQWGEMSYRIPLYSFVFMISLGVDYSIMLMSRIKQELNSHALTDAVRIGIEKTGGVISSAGLILAGTFAVLITQPVMELRMFGITMALGILVDTFIVRPFLLPSLILLCGKWSFWLPFTRK